MSLILDLELKNIVASRGKPFRSWRESRIDQGILVIDILIEQAIYSLGRIKSSGKT